MQKHTPGEQVHLVEEAAPPPSANGEPGREPAVHDVLAMMAQMLEQMEATAEQAAARAVQHAMETSARADPADPGAAERLAADEELDLIRQQKNEMDAQLERMSQQCNEFSCEKRSSKVSSRACKSS